MPDITNILNWNAITRGFYQYVIGANVCYEIIQMTDELFELYLTGLWRIKTKTGRTARSTFLREKITQGDLEGCMVAAKEDYEKNMKEV